MIEVREARAGDAAELVRLRRLMFAGMHGVDRPGAWEREAEAVARRELELPRAERSLGAFVVDGDEGSGLTGELGGGGPTLAACAVGTVEQRLPAPAHPTGRFGFVFSVCTDGRYQGRGYARAAMEALLDWFAARGVNRVDLHASKEAEHLYRALGFTEHSTPLSLHLREG
ncbi:GNAT family N-acetyltransferase [Streptomyces sp. ODS28]|uniref:GNAT family N-acetyltransferase n=1 Tax=Streptomyces sp. ODS28 TaxID=3136688 RepID=UPI0031EC079F